MEKKRQSRHIIHLMSSTIWRKIINSRHDFEAFRIKKNQKRISHNFFPFMLGPPAGKSGVKLVIYTTGKL